MIHGLIGEFQLDLGDFDVFHDPLGSNDARNPQQFCEQMLGLYGCEVLCLILRCFPELLKSSPQDIPKGDVFLLERPNVRSILITDALATQNDGTVAASASVSCLSTCSTANNAARCVCLMC